MSGRRGSILRHPDEEEFVWREWAVPFALALGAAIIFVAHALFTPAPVERAAPVPTAPVSAPPIRQTAALAETKASTAVPPEEPVAAPGVRVLLRSEGTTWAEATPDGAEPRRYELGPGQNLVVSARERLSLSLGDAGVIRLKVNERELGFIGYKGESKIDLSFVAPKPKPPAAPAAAPPAAGD